MKRVMIVTVLVGVISGFYHWWLPHRLDIEPYSPLILNTRSPSFAVDETFFYAPKLRQPLKDPGELVGSSLMALLVRLSGSTVNAFILADLIFPAMAFLTLTWLIKLWLKSDLQAIAAGLAVLVFYHYLTYFPYLPSVVKLLIDYWKNGSYWPLIRSFHPQISLGLFWLFAACLWPKRKVWWPTSLLLTLLTYTHFFYWTAALTWLLWLHFNRRLIKILVAWGLLTLPYWLYLIQMLPSVDYWQRNYFYQRLTLNQGLLIIFGLVAVWLIKDKLWRKFWLSFYAAMACLILITTVTKFGADDPIGHWFVRVINPMTAVLITITVFKKLSLPKPFWIVFSILLLIFQFRLHRQYFKNNAATFRIEPERLEAFSWLDKNTPKNSVVVAPSLTDSLYLPAYTHDQPYLLQAQLSLASNNELTNRFLQVYRLAAVPEEKIRLMFSDNQTLKAIKRFDFDNCAGHYLYFREFKGSDYYGCSIPEEKLQQILVQYKQMSPQLTYPADYWLGHQSIDFGRLMWENSSYKIYALH